MENNTIGERIKSLAKTLGSVSALAETTGIPKRSLDDYIAGTTDVKAERLAAIVKSCGVSAQWLLLGDGEPKITSTVFVSTHAGKSSGAAPLLQAWLASNELDDFQRVPLLDIRAAAGAGAWNDESRVSSYLAFRRDWLSEYAGRNLSAVALVSVNGDSMEPTLPDGCVVMIRPLLFDGAVNGIGLVQVNGMLLIKRVQTLALIWRDDNGCDIHLSLTSDNKAYPPIETWITKENEHETKVIGSAVWFGARLR
jgi:phage repressor protein C with HTH and peptisase S24 domain